MTFVSKFTLVKGSIKGIKHYLDHHMAICLADSVTFIDIVLQILQI